MVNRIGLWLVLLCAGFLAACLGLGSGGDDTGGSVLLVDTADTEEDSEDEGGCEEVTLKVIGDEPPVVGDTWVVWLYCDDALMTGVMVVQIDPTDFALIEDNEVTFVTAGTGTLTVQTGSFRFEEEVTVLEE